MSHSCGQHGSYGNQYGSPVGQEYGSLSQGQGFFKYLNESQADTSFTGQYGHGSSGSNGFSSFSSGESSSRNDPLNYDPNPLVVKKKSKPVNYVQKVNVKYLRPPTPPPPGDIIIRQERAQQAPAAPPLVIRAHPPAPVSPPPVVIKDCPPPPPPPIPPVVITVPPKRIPAPPRQVILEKLPQEPVKPADVHVEKWLPYKEQKRRVVFEKSCDPAPQQPPKNMVVEWESPECNVTRDVKFLGVEKADPNCYQCNNNEASGSPCDAPSGSAQPRVHELEGDIDALSLVDLDRHGLSQYKHYVSNNNSSSFQNSSSSSSCQSQQPCQNQQPTDPAQIAQNLFGQYLSLPPPNNCQSCPLDVSQLNLPSC